MLVYCRYSSFPKAACTFATQLLTVLAHLLKAAARTRVINNNKRLPLAQPRSMSLENKVLYGGAEEPVLIAAGLEVLGAVGEKEERAVQTCSVHREGLLSQLAPASILKRLSAALKSAPQAGSVWVMLLLMQLCES
jgi:hypothetical protein